MEKQIRNAFDNVHTSQSLKDNTMEFLATQKPLALKKRPSAFFRLTAACLTFVLFASCLTALYFIPVSAVHIDTDPASAQLKINCFDRVVDIDGDINGANVKHMKYSDAVASMINENNNKETVITVIGNEKMLTDIEANVQQNENVHCGHLSEHSAKQAESCGLSAAKYEMYLTLLQNGVAITAEQAQQMTMIELRALLNTQTDKPIPTQPNATVYEDSSANTSECESNLHHQNGQHHRHGN